jgi:hypothetical protein
LNFSSAVIPDPPYKATKGEGSPASLRNFLSKLTTTLHEAYDGQMKKWNALFWGIPAIAVYFYTATVLTGYGYASYFNIPSNFVSASLSDNIIYFFQLFIVGQYEIGLLRWWAWLIVFLVVVFITLLYFFHAFWRVFISILGTIIFFLILGGFYNFGRIIAANNTLFWMPSASCPPIGSDERDAD